MRRTPNNPAAPVRIVRYHVVSMDVWGNPIDGWDVNNWFRSGAPVLEVATKEADGEPTADEVWTALRTVNVEISGIVPAHYSNTPMIKASIRRSSIGLEWIDGSEAGGDWLVTDERRTRLPATSEGTKVPNYGWSKPVYNLERIED